MHFLAPRCAQGRASAPAVARGLVSVDGARRYGVVIENGAVDVAATESLRASMSAERGEPEIFNFGGSIDEIKARCEEETHLPAPAEPQFVNAG